MPHLSGSRLVDFLQVCFAVASCWTRLSCSTPSQVTELGVLLLVPAGGWLAKQQRLEVVTAPFYHDDEVELFDKMQEGGDIRTRHGNIKTLAATKEFNHVVSESIARNDGRKLTYKTQQQVSKYVELLKNRSRATGAIEDILDELRCVRALLRGCDDWLEWIEPMNEQQPAAATARKRKTGNDSSRASASVHKTRPNDDIKKPVKSLLNDSPQVEDTEPQTLPIGEQRVVRCSVCQQPKYNNPAHSRSGWCGVKKAWGERACCPTCKMLRRKCGHLDPPEGET